MTLTKEKPLNKGLIYLFTGDGKGKTSAALGMVLRASCTGKKVAWVAWYKSGTWDISEKNISKLLPGVVFYLMGEGFYIKSKTKDQIPKPNAKPNNFKILRTKAKVFDLVSKEDHKIAAEKALEKAKEILKSRTYFLLVCDEICNALQDGLLEIKQVKELIELRGKTHLVLTGRNASKELIENADLVSEIKKIKHPYDLGISAVKGLDF